jgi:pimeloyl-ACP methyl ester carboxylesterase
MRLGEKMEPNVTFNTIRTNGIQLHTALSGPEDGEPVILLHGYPDAWFGWASQIAALASAGFRVIAPDQRGYNLSDKPRGISQYTQGILVNDITGLADSLGIRRFHLAGHDFGAAVSWRLASLHPERLMSLAILNVPHPEVMIETLGHHPAQMLKSWYIFFFQLPGLPEAAMRANNWRTVIRAMPSGLSDAQKDAYRAAWSQPDAIRSMINWYRAAFRLSGLKIHSTGPVRPPTLLIWGKNDPYLSYGMVQPSLRRCLNGRLVTFENASHWVMADEADPVSRLLVEHFQKFSER